MLVPNTILQSRYRILRQLGQGGMGTVYEAIDERLGTTVALKECHFTDEHLRKQFEREARLLARLRHPAMTRVVDHFQDSSGQFLVMDFVAGEDLSEVPRRRGGSLPVSEVLAWADQLLDALEYLHSQEPPVVHRDIKPQNLKLTARNQIILLDFGLAKGFAGPLSHKTTLGSIFGYTPDYAPLEQIQGTGTDPRSDLYSLAATLYHLMTDNVPPNVLTRLTATIDGQADPLRPAHEVNLQVTSDIAAVLSKAMAIGRNQRFATAAEMRKALRGASKPQGDTGDAARTADLQPTVLSGSPRSPAIADDSGPISQELGPTVAAPTVAAFAAPSPASSSELPPEFTDSRPFSEVEGLGDTIADLFGEAFGEPSGRMHGQDVEAEISITLEEAHRGVSRSQTVQILETCAICGGMDTKKDKPCPTCRGAGSVAKPKMLDVNIPAGVSAGSRIRLAGLGEPGKDGAPAGQLYLHIRIEPHRVFNPVGEYDVQVELAVASWEAAPGTIVNVPTLDGPVKIKIPASPQESQRIRLRGRGLNKLRGGRGDLYVKLKIVSPPEKEVETPLPGSATIIGIDFGTSKSVVTVLKGGKATVISNEDSGLRAIPSVVAFTKDGTRLVGQVANRQAVTNPENTVYSIKRFMGRRFNEVAEEIKHVLFKVEAAKDGDVRIRVGGKVYSAPEIAAMILERMKQSAEDYLGHKVNKVVITVPPYFNEAQRRATKDACEIAGLQVMRLINGPSAAAVAYGLDKTKNETIAVFDFGGGTFNISIVEVGEGVVEVKSTCGDPRLGGDDIDARLTEWIIEEFKRNQGCDLSNEKMALQRLKEAAEKAKMELSTAIETEINLPFITADQYGAKHLVMKLTRSRFEQLIAPILQRIKPLVEQALKDAGLAAKQINEVVLVGGSTRIQQVQQLVRDIFGKEPNRSVNADDGVAVGTALLAGVLSGEKTGPLLMDVTPLSLGIETSGGVFTKLIERNTMIPTRKAEIFSTAEDNQPSVEVHALQGESSMARDNQTLSKFRLAGIPLAPRGVPQIEVIFDIDANGIMNVSAKDKNTGREQKITITASSGCSKDESDRMKGGADSPVGRASLMVIRK